MLTIRGLWLSIFPFIALARLQPIDFSAGNVPTVSHSLIGGKLRHLSDTLATQNDSDPFKGVKYHSGFINLGNEGGEMFYWYFPRENGSDTTKMVVDTPLLLWLNGGPGASSVLAALTENGPLTIQPDGTVTRNPNSWSTVADVVYIEPALGPRYSIVGDTSDKVANSEMVATDMRDFLVQFVEKYPNLKNRRFFLAGKNHAGKFIPLLGNLLLKSPIEDLDFVGVAIGNGWVDGKLQFPAYADFAFEHKMVEEVDFRNATEALKSCVPSMDEHQPITKECISIVDGLLGRKNPFDIRLNCEDLTKCYNKKSLIEFLSRDDVQDALGAYTEETADLSLVRLLLSEYFAEFSTKVGELLKAGKQVLVYSGDQDFVYNWRGGEAWVNNMEWGKQDEFRSKPYSSWDVKKKPSGAIKKVDNLTFLRVFDAGGMVPMDQPEAALAMITSFMTNNFNDYDFTISSETIDSNKEKDKEGSLFLALS